MIPQAPYRVKPYLRRRHIYPKYVRGILLIVAYRYGIIGEDSERGGTAGKQYRPVRSPI